MPEPTPLTIEEALWSESYAWLEANAPKLLDAVQHAVTVEQQSPREVFLRVLRTAGQERIALATRCQQAALYLLSPERP